MNDFSDTADSTSEAAQKAVQMTRGTVLRGANSVVAYTRDNPMKALMLAAGSGALLLTLVKALSISRK